MSPVPAPPPTLLRLTEDPSGPAFAPRPLSPSSQHSPRTSIPPPSVTRPESSDASDSSETDVTANAASSPNGSTGTSHYVPKAEPDLEQGPSGPSSQFVLCNAPPAPHSMPRSMADGDFEAPQVEGMVQGTYDANGDFVQTFYDPFRVKHRRRTSPVQLKVLEYHFEHNPKPDVSLRKALSEQLEMTPREVQVWFQNRRAKTKKLREKQEKEAIDDDHDLPYSKEPSYSSHPYDPAYNPPHNDSHLLPPPPHLPHDFNALRRGSSPAALSSGHIMYASHHEPPPFQPHDASPAHYPTPLHPSAQSYYPPQQDIYPSPMSLGSSGLPSPSLSPPDAHRDYPQQPPRRFNALEEAGHVGRRFSLPAYSSSYAAEGAGAQWSPSAEMEDPMLRHSLSFIPQAASFAYVTPPLGAHSSSDQDFISPNGSGPARDAGFHHPRDDDEFSPGSSPDDQMTPHDYTYPPGAPFGPGAGSTHYEQAHGTVPLSQYSFGTMQQHSTVGSTDGDVSLLGTSPGTSLDGFSHYNGRRASCPAGFLPTFDHLGLASPVTAHASWPNPPPPNGNQHPSTLHKRHSFAVPSSAPYPTNPVHACAPPLPLYGLPLTSLANPSPPVFAFTNPQFLQPTGRRGSTSSMLGTIAEQVRPYGESFEEQSGRSGPERRLSSASATRKVRSPVNLRGPYPSQEQRSPGGGERRGSPSGLAVDYQ